MHTKARGAGLAAILLGLAALAASFQPPPAPARWVTDTVGFLSEPTRRALDARLERYERDTGRQVIVWIGESTGDVPLEEWAARTFEAWGIGGKGRDDGAALFVFAKDRRLRIEVGYGLEPVVPDAIASRLIQQEATPRLRAGDPDGAVSATVGALLGALGGETSPPPAAPPVRPSLPALGTGQLILFGVLGLLLLVFLVTHPRMALFLLFQIMSSSGSGGGRRGGGGGGFRGGGGRSGGGGASGSW
ncbi:MAG TPA: TPM domain-containing protein [Archangium sp.]|uniref:TPM domain-containing protein n=1 Tax=Archangium sp. TaxID=1872627 RepID=UPI002E3041FF|nr:TPM domain-containing protein [Archangium sp.]HEX5752122.1 TPM domain-containing protein [Archangium sp.]